jgi:hypothetical protein
MTLKPLPAVLLLLALTSVQQAVAHHSVPVNFDQSREITIEGVLTEVAWHNPHCRFMIEVTAEDGSKTEWLAEMGALNTLTRAGFPTERFAVGDRVAITGNPGWRGRTMRLQAVVLQDGTRLTESMTP